MPSSQSTGQDSNGGPRQLEQEIFSMISQDATNAARAQILDEWLFQSKWLRTANFEAIHTTDLQLLFELYDQHFFEKRLRDILHTAKTPLSFRLSRRMTSAGGKTTAQLTKASKSMHRKSRGSHRPTSYEIALSTTLLYESFGDGNPRSVVGVTCETRADAAMRVFEHELVHLIEFMLWSESSCSKGRFRTIATHRFGHRESHHQLTTPRETARKQYSISPGDQVTFCFEGQHHVGFVNRITRRATVLVPSNQGERYSDGVRYDKYYIPLNMLNKVA